MIMVKLMTQVYHSMEVTRCRYTVSLPIKLSLFFELKLTFVLYMVMDVMQNIFDLYKLGIFSDSSI